MKYSQERKQAVLVKLAPPHQRTVKDVVADPSRPSITGASLFLDDGADPEGWTARDRFTAVIETALNESACPARSRRAPSIAESAGSIPSRSPPGKGPVSLRRIGPVSMAGSRPPWIVRCAAEGDMLLDNHRNCLYCHNMRAPINGLSQDELPKNRKKLLAKPKFTC